MHRHAPGCPPRFELDAVRPQWSVETKHRAWIRSSGMAKFFDTVERAQLCDLLDELDPRHRRCSTRGRPVISPRIWSSASAIPSPAPGLACTVRRAALLNDARTPSRSRTWPGGICACCPAIGGQSSPPPRVHASRAPASCPQHMVGPAWSGRRSSLRGATSARGREQR
jgi:hypothetical protein